MAIQPFAMQGQSVNMMLPSEALTNAYNLKNKQMQSDVMAGEMRDNALMDKAYRASGGDLSKMQADPNMGFSGGMKIAGMRADMATAQAQADKARKDEKLGQVEYLTKVNDYAAQLAGAANDQASWDQVRRHIGETLGAEALSRMPEQYSEEAKNTVLQGSLSLKDKLDMARQDLAERRANQQQNYQNASLDMMGRRIDASERNAALRSGDGGEKTKYAIIYDAQGNAYTKNVNAPNEPPIPMTMPSSGAPSGQPAPTGMPVQQPPASFRKAVTAPTQKAFTQDQSKAAIYGKRMEQAAKILDTVGSDYNATGLALKGSLEELPLVGTYAGMAANQKISSNDRQVEQAQLNILNAILRQESGATIGSPEFKKAQKQYFVQPGDDEATIANKRQNLQTAIEGMKNESGPAWMADKQQPEAPANRQIVRTGTVNGRKVVQYSDGTKEYAQ